MIEDRATNYAQAVSIGFVIAGPHVRDACTRHLNDLKRTDITWDLDAANRVIRFFETKLKLSEGQFEGIPFKLHPSQAFIIGCLFGWKRANGTRRFRRAYIEMGKGNGKSPLVGGLGLYGMAADGEPGAEIYSAGATRDQAGILFRDAVKMAKQSPGIDKRMTYSGNASVWNMSMLGGVQKGSFFRPLARTAGKSGSGPRPQMAFADELHEHPDRSVLDMLERGFKFRRQPLLVMITNSGTDRNSVCWEEHEHAIAVASGKLEDDATFSYVCALDKGDDPLKHPRCWIKANPLLGVTITDEYLAGVVQQGKQIPGKLNGILRLHFCVWTDAETAWLPRETWEAIEDPDMKIEDFIGVTCSVGLDLSSTRDLTGTAHVFEDGFTDDGRPKFAAFAHGYTPAATLEERAKLDRASYDVWVRKGFLTATPGPVIRYDTVAHDLLQDKERFDLVNVAYDRYLIKRFEEALSEMNGELPLIEHPQSIAQRKDTPLWMPQSIDYLEELILEKRLRVHINPALRSAVASATFWTSPAELRRFDKAKATGRIDLLIALAQAVGAAMIPYADMESIYDKLGQNKRAASEAAKKDDGVSIDYDILNDVNHPLFAEMARRFERKRALEHDDDF